MYNKTMKYKNTLNKGSVRYIIFKDDGVWYGVALEFNIVEEGDNPIEVMASLFQAIEGYVEAAKKLKIHPAPLNQKPDKEYEDMWGKLQENKEAKALKLDQVYTYGCTPFNLSVLA